MLRPLTARSRSSPRRPACPPPLLRRPCRRDPSPAAAQRRRSRHASSQACRPRVLISLVAPLAPINEKKRVAAPSSATPEAPHVRAKARMVETIAPRNLIGQGPCPHALPFLPPTIRQWTQAIVAPIHEDGSPAEMWHELVGKLLQMVGTKDTGPDLSDWLRLRWDECD